MTQPQQSTSDGRFVARSAASRTAAVFSLFGFALTFIVSISSLNKASKANDLANEAIHRNDLLAERNEAFQLRLKNLDQYFASPRLKVIRFRKITAARYVVTVQNEGQREVAIFGATLNPSRIIGATTGTPTPFVPESNQIVGVEIPFREPGELSVQLPVPARVHPGEIVNVALTLAEGSSEGDIFLDHSAGPQMHVGLYSMAPLPYPPAPAAPSPQSSEA